MILLLGLAAVAIVALVVATVVAIRRRHQRVELQAHFHSAYDEGARWKPLGDAEDPVDQ